MADTHRDQEALVETLVGRLDLPDKPRDEDGYQLDVWDCIRVAEIGSEAWIKAELAAGRSGEERDA